MNDRFAAKTSADIRRTFATKRSKGEFIGAFAPYGYLKNPENKNALVIDDRAAEIIRDIFSLYLSGMSKNGIVRHLNDRGIPCPALYKKRVLGLKYENPHFDPAAKPLWSHSTIHEILKNRMYCGDMVQGRYRVKSYKVHVQERVDETECTSCQTHMKRLLTGKLLKKYSGFSQKTPGYLLKMTDCICSAVFSNVRTVARRWHGMR